jgi:hypothetical protein
MDHATPAGRRRAALLLGWAVASALAGCSSVTTMQAYPEPAPAPQDVASLRVVNHRSKAAVWNAVVEQVDGREPPWLFRATATDRNFLFSAPTGQEKLIELGPGSHTVRVGFFWDELGGGGKPDDLGTCTLVFEAAPGGAYDLESSYELESTADWFLEERAWRAWVVDTATGDTVSSPECKPAAG